MDIEKRLSNLESLVDALSKKIDRNYFYQSADTQGNRQSITKITPYTSTKIGYYGDTEMNFYEVPQGNVEVFFNSENRACTLERVGNRLIVKFGALTDRTNITIIVK